MNAIKKLDGQNIYGYRSGTDPGAIGAGRFWIDTSGGSGHWVLRVRNAANAGWEAVGRGFDPAQGEAVLFPAGDAPLADESILPGYLNLSLAESDPSVVVRAKESGGNLFTSTLQSFEAFLKTIKPNGLIFLGPMNEKTGTTADDKSSQNNDGTYRDAGMLNKGTFLTGEPCPQFVPADGDYVNLPAGFLADFNLDEYCILQFLRVRNVGVWSDGTVRSANQMRRDNNNRTQISRTTTNNQLRFLHSAGGTVDAVFATLSTTDWFMATQRVSRSEDTMKAYINDAQVGETQTGIGTAAGTIGTAVIGAGFVPSTDTWDGFEAYTVVWSGAGNLPSDAEIAGIWDFLAG